MPGVLKTPSREIRVLPGLADCEILARRLRLFKFMVIVIDWC